MAQNNSNLFAFRKLLFKLYVNLPGLQYVFQGIKAIYLPPYRLRKWMRFKGWFDLKVAEGISIKLMNYGNTIENELFWNGCKGWEEESIRLWVKLCRHSDVILDIGANNGLYTLVAYKAKSTARIHSFEPLPPIFKHLQRNVENNHVKASLNNIALGDQNGESLIYFVKTISDTFDQASLNPNHFKRPSVGVPIVIKTLEEIILQQGIEKIDLIKIDVETYEPQVLRGMQQYLKHFKPTILIEVLNARVAIEVWSLIEDLGYMIKRIDEDSGLVNDSMIPFSKAGNYLLLNTSTHSLT